MTDTAKLNFLSTQQQNDMTHGDKAAYVGNDSDYAWAGKWIWYPERRTFQNTFVYFRRRFYLNDTPRCSAIHISADSRYQLFVNGVFVGRGPAVYAPDHPTFDTYDTCDLLRKGDNLVAVMAYCYAVPTNTYVTSISGAGTGGLLCDVETADESHDFTVGTDETWVVMRSAAYPYRSERMNRWRSLVEVFDACAEPEGWTDVSFDDSSWRNAVAVDQLKSIRRTDTGILEPRPIPLLSEEQVSATEVINCFSVDWRVDAVEYLLNREREEPHVSAPQGFSREERGSDTVGGLRVGPAEYPIRIHCAGDRSIAAVFGLPKYTAGRVTLTVDAGAGTAITIILHEKRPADPATALQPIHGNWVRFVCAGGSRTYSSVDVCACRYMTVVVDGAGSFQLDDVGMRQQSYPTEVEGEFESSDTEIDELYSASKATLEACMHDIITDNTWREFQNWSGDIEHAKLSMYRCFGAYRLARRSLSLIGTGVTDAGRVTSAWPSSVAFFRAMEGCWVGKDRSFGPELPTHGMRWISSLWQYYLHSGDVTLLYETRPAVKSAMNWYQSHLGSNGLLSLDLWDFAWHHVDHLGPAYPPVIPTNLLYCACLIDASSIASAVGEDAESDMLLDAAHRLADAIHSESWDPKLSVHADVPSTRATEPHVSEHVLALTLLLGLVPDEHTDRVVDLLSVGGSNVHRGTPTFRNSIHWALASVCRSDLVVSELSELWSNQSSLAETGTFAEHFDPKLNPEWDSYCQSAAAIPAYAISSYLLGVRPIKPGFEEFVVAPTAGHLSFVRGDVPTPKGKIEVAWNLNDDGDLHKSVIHPKGTTWREPATVGEGVPYWKFRQERTHGRNG